MKIKKSPLLMTFICTVLLLIWLGISGSFSIRRLSDGLFLLCLPFLIIGVTRWLLGTTFFDLFHYSMNKAIHGRSKKPNKKEFVPVSQFVRKKDFFYLKTAGCLLAASLICLLLEFFFK